MTMVSKKNEIAAGLFKARCLRHGRDRKAQAAADDYQAGNPVVKVVPITDDATSVFGSLAERFEIAGDIEAPILPIGGWNALK